MLTSRTLRWAGFAGALLLFAAGLLGGALPATGVHHLPVIVLWLTGTGLMGYAWWAGREREHSVRWVLGTIALWTAPFLFLPPVGSRDFYSYSCQGELYAQGLSPYSATAETLPCTWLDAVPPIWQDTVTPYGPLFVVLAGAIVAAGKALPVAPAIADALPPRLGSLLLPLVLFRLVALAGVLAMAAGLPALARRCGVPPARALWLALAGPLVGAHLLGGPHNDAVMLGLLVGGLAVPVRFPRRAVATVAGGVLLGGAVAVKASALIAVPFAVLIVAGARAAGRRIGLRDLVAGTAGVAVPAVATLGGITVLAGLDFGWVAGLRDSEALVQFTSMPTAVGMTVTYAGQLFDRGFDAVPAVRSVAFVLLAVVLVVIWVRSARDRVDPVRAALTGAAAAMVATVALAPVFLPWYTLWPLTLLAVTAPGTRAMLLIAIGAAFSVLPDGSGLVRHLKFPGALLVTGYLVYLGVRRLRRPARDRRRQPPSEAEPSTRVTLTSMTTRAGLGRGVR
ncbi:polyprenol phosphomannose-dependent alpha 1,6 mannosyltransferase MptB [Actinoplanes oblitus]|uniref:Polyprenol phosphomannose-dependent alpha 1,6 mannosyltransferase MptB n=1 Tax=Actinoplanes oblitus TaxID=3040509 RepID=A0ABY8W7L8_9ACTN|nr:polyprenol phosphomannose-dependent alpha 1,6 mannosyltransferase MptB [Actinoplanes oblitus]WIM93668.1 polyprenol phosphomannose-dependent alpha 1,6 mannosyltransferase MptB [Actinoplanes oblitus]